MVATTPRKRTARKNVSLSLPADLVDHLDGWAKAGETNRSALVSELIQAEQRRRFEAQLEQDVRDAVTEGFYDDIEFYFPAQAEVALAIPYEP